jgi:hypothetical protein
MIEPNTDDALCECCKGPFSAFDRAVCNSCGRPFHLAMRTDVELNECGQVWINEELEALEFGCNDCLRAAGRLPQNQSKRRYVRSDREAVIKARRNTTARKTTRRRGSAL